MFRGPIRIPDGNDFTLCFPWYEKRIVDSKETLDPISLEECAYIQAKCSMDQGVSWINIDSSNISIQGNRVYIKFFAGFVKGVVSVKITCKKELVDLSCSWNKCIDVVKWTNTQNYSEFVQGSPYLMPSNVAVIAGGTYNESPDDPFPQLECSYDDVLDTLEDVPEELDAGTYPIICHYTDNDVIAGILYVSTHESPKITQVIELLTTDNGITKVLWRRDKYLEWSDWEKIQ